MMNINIAQQNDEWLRNRYQELKGQQQDAVDKLKKMAPHYRDQITIAHRVMAVAVVALVAVAILRLKFSSLQEFIDFSRQSYGKLIALERWKLMTIGAVSLGWLAGAFIVIHRARTKGEELLEAKALRVNCEDGSVQVNTMTEYFEKTKGRAITSISVIKQEGEEQKKLPSRGAIWGISKYLETIHIGSLDHTPFHYADTSTLDENRSGRALMYGVKDCSNHYSVSTVVMGIFPIPVSLYYLVAPILYNAVRIFAAPLYVLIQWAREKCTGKQLYPNERKFELQDAAKECGKSVARLVKAPFYWLAFNLSSLYSYVNPMGGRKLASLVERDWNEGVTLNEGFWSINGGMGLWRFEGGGGPNSLGRNGYYVPGCWQPTKIAEYENGKITAIYRIEAVVDADKSLYKARRTDGYVRYENSFQFERRIDVEAPVVEFKSIEKELKKRNLL